MHCIISDIEIETDYYLNETTVANEWELSPTFRTPLPFAVRANQSKELI